MKSYVKLFEEHQEQEARVSMDDMYLLLSVASVISINDGDYDKFYGATTTPYARHYGGPRTLVNRDGNRVPNLGRNKWFKVETVHGDWFEIVEDSVIVASGKEHNVTFTVTQGNRRFHFKLGFPITGEGAKDVGSIDMTSISKNPVLLELIMSVFKHFSGGSLDRFDEFFVGNQDWLTPEMLSGVASPEEIRRFMRKRAMGRMFDRG
jgi:hypothetical protein